MRLIKASIEPIQRKARELRDSPIVREASWLAGAKIIQGVASILATFVIARYLGPGRFGELSLGIATASLVATATALGLEHIATRELALDGTAPLRTGLAFATLRRLRLLGAIAGVLLLLVASLTENARQYGISGLLFALCLLPLAQVGDLSEWRLIATGRSRKVAMVTASVAPLAALGRLALAFSASPLVAFGWILVAEFTVRSTLLKLATRSLDAASPSKGVASATAAIGLLRESMPLLLSGLAVFVYMRIDQFMIAGMLGIRQVGLYSAIVMLAEMPLVLPVLLLKAALPALTKKSADNSVIMEQALVRLMRSVFLLHAVVAIVLALFAEIIVVTLYGENYRAAVLAFRIQVLGAPFVALGVLSSAWLVLHRCTGHAFRRTIIGAIANIALNFVLIPRCGIAGAAAATLVAQLIATYLADLCYAETRELFIMKTRAILPRIWLGT